MVILHSLSIFFLVASGSIAFLLICFLFRTSSEYSDKVMDEWLRWLLAFVGAVLVSVLVALSSYYATTYNLTRAEYDRRVEGMCYGDAG